MTFYYKQLLSIELSYVAVLQRWCAPGPSAQTSAAATRASPPPQVGAPAVLVLLITDLIYQQAKNVSEVIFNKEKHKKFPFTKIYQATCCL